MTRQGSPRGLLDGTPRPEIPDWTDAACRRGYDPDLWHPHLEKALSVRIPIQVCSSCPLIHDCLRYALTLHAHLPVTGIWGGLTTRQRLKLLTHQGSSKPTSEGSP